MFNVKSTPYFFHLFPHSLVVNRGVYSVRAEGAFAHVKQQGHIPPLNVPQIKKMPSWKCSYMGQGGGRHHLTPLSAILSLIKTSLLPFTPSINIICPRSKNPVHASVCQHQTPINWSKEIFYWSWLFHPYTK